MKTKEIVISATIGAIPVIWLGLLLAPYSNDGIVYIISHVNDIFDDPLHIQFTGDSIRMVLLFLLIYAFGIGVYMSSRKNYRRGEEHGSAKWGSPSALNRKYANPKYEGSKILSQNVRIGLDGRKHGRNLNVLVIGGSGSGKTRFYCKPNLMQVSDGISFFALDPKGELVSSCGNLLKSKGYEIRILDLISMDKSHCYNPFVYLRDDNDVQRLVTNLFKATTPKEAKSNDPFWDTAAQMLLLALMFYLLYEAPPEEQNFAMVMDMIRYGEVDEVHNLASPLDNLFNDLRKTEPNHIAIKYYDAYHSGAAKTLKSIQITLVSHLEKFNLESVAKLTITDEMDLDKIGEKKYAIFAIIPDNDTSFNFLVSMLYTQMFQQLFEVADRKYGGTLPLHVHLILDEFANVSLPGDFDKILSVMRSRGVSVSIILQNLTQLKKLFEKEWESIVGNCDEFVYLGGNEQATHKYVSELLGKETIDINTFNRTFGSRGNYSRNDSINGREIMMPDEVRLLDNRNEILFIRGERPVIDLKYDIMKHPNVAFTADGHAEPYVHGETADALGTIEIIEPGDRDNEGEKNIPVEGRFELLTEKEIEDEIKRTEGENTNDKAE